MKKLVFSKTTRIVHLSFALLIILAYLSSEFDEKIWIHAVLGITAFCVILVRFFWFYFGEQAVKFNTFDLNFHSLKQYLLDYFNFKENKLRNPATSFGIVFIWIFAILTIVFGLLFIGSKYGSGLFWFIYNTNTDTHLLKELHGIFGNLLIATAGIHVLGVVGESYLKKTEIFKTMYDGKIKTNIQIHEPSSLKNSNLFAGFVGLIIVGIFSYLAINKNNIFLSSEKIHTDFSKLMPVSYNECKECHMFYPPNITNKSSQLIMLDNLSNHFGTDASLDYDVLQKVKNEVEKFAPEITKIKLEGDSKFLAINESITNTKLWKRKHKEFDNQWFVEHKIKKTDCKSCHTKIENGSLSPFELKVDR
jgi:cytochrome b